MSEQGTYYTSTSSVTGERQDTTFTIRVSARPEITYVRPPHPSPIWDDHTPRAVVGFPSRIILDVENHSPVNIEHFKSTYTSGDRKYFDIWFKIYLNLFAKSK